MKPHRHFETKECLDKACTMSLHHLQSLLKFEPDSGSGHNNDISEKGVCKHWRLDMRFCMVIAETCLPLVFTYIMTLFCLCHCSCCCLCQQIVLMTEKTVLCEISGSYSGGAVDSSLPW